eukprot:COSAG04_NODE_29425_length_269_cov_0.605882_1_plen_42_part_00
MDCSRSLHEFEKSPGGVSTLGNSCAMGVSTVGKVDAMGLAL